MSESSSSLRNGQHFGTGNISNLRTPKASVQKMRAIPVWRCGRQEGGSNVPRAGLRGFWERLSQDPDIGVSPGVSVKHYDLTGLLPVGDKRLVHHQKSRKNLMFARQLLLPRIEQASVRWEALASILLHQNEYGTMVAMSPVPAV